MARRFSQQNNYSREQQMALQASLRRGRVVSTPASAVTNRGQQSNSRLRQRSDKERNTPILPKGNQRVYDGLTWFGKTAAESVALGAGGAAVIRGVTRLGAKAAGRYVGNTAAQAALRQNMKGLSNASGAGGKISKTQTPFGPTLRSTKIGSPAERSARINNLVVAAEKKAAGTGADAGSRAMIDVFKAGNRAKQGATTVGGGVITQRNRRRRNK